MFHAEEARILSVTRASNRCLQSHPFKNPTWAAQVANAQMSLGGRRVMTIEVEYLRGSPKTGMEVLRDILYGWPLYR